MKLLSMGKPMLASMVIMKAVESHGAGVATPP